MIALPTDYADVIALADWLELSALEAGDRNTSVGDLTGALTFLNDDYSELKGLTPQEDGSELEELALQVMGEVGHRANAAGDAYPFEVNGASVIQAKPDSDRYIAYIFCLCLSYFRWKAQKGVVSPWALFEDLASLAAKHYLQGEVYKFGFTSAAEDQPGFAAKVDQLCRLIGEGRGSRKRPRLNKKDDHVDLVAWKNFADNRESKLVMFGQCAAGATNWEAKVTELTPEPFWRYWMTEPHVSPLLRSFFVPFRIPDEKFLHVADRAGILFDRCRIAHSVWRANDEVVKDGRYRDWCNLVFPAASSDNR